VKARAERKAEGDKSSGEQEDACFHGLTVYTTTPNLHEEHLSAAASGGVCELSTFLEKLQL
jgi:uncharacterized protein YeaC (DUF1315 family)